MKTAVPRDKLFLHSKELTCVELKMRKNQAKTVEFAFSESMPNIHVSPSRGRRITTDLKVVLNRKGRVHYEMDKTT